MKRWLLAASFCILAPWIQAQDNPEPDTPAPAPEEAKPAAEGAGRGGGPAGRGGQNANEPRPYDRVITKDAKTKAGIFKVHQVGTRWYYEIPKSELGKDFLLVTQIARNTIGAGYGGQMVNDLVVRWERRENRVFLRNVNYEIVADPQAPIARAVEAANTPAIMMAFNIEAIGPDESVVIDPTRLFTTDVPEMSSRNAVRGRGMDAQRSFLEKITPYPTNIEVEATHTYTNPVDANAAGAGGRGGGGRGGMRPGSGTVTVHYSMVKLPEKPMMARLADSRVGYFTTSSLDFSRPEHRAERRTFITRWRLEKKDPSAAVSEPVKPIVYYIDPATPKQWVPYLKKGVESWQPAFEAAGFKNAIIAKDPPSKEEDPDWSPEDARYSVIRWLPSTTENASGPHIHDPRTGEILEADIQFYHNVMNLVRDWYFVQVGPVDPRARKLPLPDELMGELLTFVTAHEVGHTLGLQHNMKASATYPVEKLRDPEWLRRMQHTPTIMDYSRFNYLVQPEDNVPVDLLIPKQGPYDFFAIKWGYQPIPSAKTPDEEKPTLNAWALQQDSSPWLRFSTADAAGSDPGENTEAVGDADAVYATGLGLKNLQRVMDMMLPAVAKEGEDWTELEQVYARALGQWSREMGHVISLIGGYDSQEKHAGQEGVRFTPVDRKRQKEAMAFLNAHALATPQMFLKPEILRRIEPSGALDRIRTAQTQVLTALLEPRRFRRLVEQEAVDGAAAYRPAEFLEDLRRGVFGEMYESRVAIDAYRRNLQRAYLELIATRLNGPQRPTDDQRPFLRGELVTIAADAAKAARRATDRDTRLHLEDVQDQIAKILDPKFQLTTGQGAAQGQGGPAPSFELELGGEFCWPDYAIRSTGF